MTRYKITVEYDGTSLIGWQQNDQGDSVQSLLQHAIYQFAQQRVDVYSAGRTDAGVHAWAMVAHFDLARDTDANTVMRAMNFYLKNKPVTVLDCTAVDDEFHARFSCTRRNYQYRILNRPSPAVLDKNRVWHVPGNLDINAMKSAAEKLIGNHDFTSFRASQCQAASPIKTLDRIDINRVGDIITIDVSARSFLHHMVRNIVGTLVEIGQGKPHDIDQILAARDRSAAGVTAPAAGLYFVSAEY